MAVDRVAAERQRRHDMWTQLLAAGGPDGVPAAVLRELGIYGGAQGVWVDKDRTAALVPRGTGVTVGLLHTGRHYPDDISDDGVIYHYPQTNRPPARDANEVEATKHTGQLRLPVFVITQRNHTLRNVRRGWVQDWDDDSRLFLIVFGSGDVEATDGNVPASRQQALAPTRAPISPVSIAVTDEEPFIAFEPAPSRRREVPQRSGQQRFKFAALKRYGPKCGVCGITVLELLQAAHLIPKEDFGSDDPRNGLVLCANHHLAFDAGLFGIEPVSLAVRLKAGGPSQEALGVTVEHLSLLHSRPHVEALGWRYERWCGATHGT